jgi:hypothetical protein
MHCWAWYEDQSHAKKFYAKRGMTIDFTDTPLQPKSVS